MEKAWYCSFLRASWIIFQLMSRSSSEPAPQHKSSTSFAAILLYLPGNHRVSARHISSFRAVTDPGMPIADRVLTRTPRNGVKTLQYFMEALASGIWWKALVRSDTMMYFHLAIVRMVESTSGNRDGCGLLYRPTSAKAVTSRCHPLGFLMRNDVLWFSTVMPRFSGGWKCLAIQAHQICVEARPACSARQIFFRKQRTPHWQSDASLTRAR